MKLAIKLLSAYALVQSAALAGPIPFGAGTTTQNFNTLPAGADKTAFKWIDDSTLPGWYVHRSNSTTHFAGDSGAFTNAYAVDGSTASKAAPAATTVVTFGDAADSTNRSLGFSPTTGPSGAYSATVLVFNGGESSAIAFFQNTGLAPVRIDNVAYKFRARRTNAANTNVENLTVSSKKAADLATLLAELNGAAAAGTFVAGLGYTDVNAAALNTAFNASTAVGGPFAAATQIDFTLAKTGAPTASIIVNPGQVWALRFGCPNAGGDDGYRGIDDVEITHTELSGSINPALSAVRVNAGDIAVATDDTATVTVNVASAGTVSATWTVSGPPGNPAIGQTGAYNTDVVLSGVPVNAFTNGVGAVEFQDTGIPSIAATATVRIPVALGANSLDAGRIIFSDGAATTNWVFDETLLTSTQNAATQVDHVVDSQSIDLTTTGYVQVSATLDAIAGTSSGFEAADRFRMDVLLDGSATAISILGTEDNTPTGAPDGLLSGAATGGTELPDASVTSFTKTFTFSYVVPASANSLKIRFVGNSNSGNETYLVKNIKLEAPPAGIVALVGTVTIDNKGTDAPADDTFGAPVTIDAISLGATTGWTSNRVTPDQGLYGVATVFSDDVATATLSVELTDKLTPTVTKNFAFGLPTQSIDATAPAAITRVVNTPGIADDTVTFTSMVTMANAGPRWTASVPAPYTISPTTGSYGAAAVTFTIGNPAATAGPVAVTITDVSYPALTKALSVTLPLPARYDIGQKNLGAGLELLQSALNPSADWVNNFATRELRMSSQPATAQVVESDTVDLTALGEVVVSAKLVPSDTSAGSNFETVDKFKIELVYTEGATTITKNLITEHDAAFPIGDAARWDKGAGQSSTTVLTAGAVGDPDGWLNGYVGTAGLDIISSIDYAAGGLVAEDEYNANKSRDEFNKLGEVADVTLNTVGAAVNGGIDGVAFSFDFSYTIPASADSAKLVITGVSAGGTEALLVKDVLFALPPVGPVDTDLDGMTDAYEDANGLDKNSPADKFLDKDGDGQSNFAEFCAGTGANDPTSSLKIISIVPGAVAGTYDVTWSSVAGKTYQAQESTDLGAVDTWANIGAAVPSGGATTTVNIPVGGGGPVHFLRIKTVP